MPTTSNARSPIRRRDFTAALTAAGFAAGAGGSAQAAAPKPNFVLMMADDLGYSDLSCYGSRENKTPVLDQLAADGMRFTDFYAACAVCSPSRAAFMTGRFPVRVGVYSWIDRSHKMHLRREEVTIAKLLKNAGYSTAHLGKWHLGYNLTKGSGGPDPGDHGFDYWMATGNNASPSHHNPDVFVRNGVPAGVIEGYSCQIVVDEAIQWLNKQAAGSAPFYLNLWFHESHFPVAAPEEYRKQHLHTKQPDYHGCIENMDNAIGRLLEKLDALGVRDNTVVVFTSDNGSYISGSNDPLTGKKRDLWEGGIREPAIVRWPGKIRKGTVSETPAGLVDLLPTVCDIAAIPPPRDRTIDGASLKPLFSGAPLQRKAPLYWFYDSARPVCAIRDGDYSLVSDPDLDLSRNNMFREDSIGAIKAAKLINFRLYNLRTDIRQQKNLAEEQKEVFSRMKQKMLALHADVMREAYDWRQHPSPTNSK